LNSKGGLSWNALVGMAAACPMPVVYLNCTNSITNEVAG
jgi:lipoprotein